MCRESNHHESSNALLQSFNDAVRWLAPVAPELRSFHPQFVKLCAALRLCVAARTRHVPHVSDDIASALIVKLAHKLDYLCQINYLPSTWLLWEMDHLIAAHWRHVNRFADESADSLDSFEGVEPSPAISGLFDAGLILQAMKTHGANPEDIRVISVMAKCETREQGLALLDMDQNYYYGVVQPRIRRWYQRLRADNLEILFPE